MSVRRSSKAISSQASFGSRSLVSSSSATVMKELRSSSVGQYGISRDYDVLSYRSWMPDNEDTLCANEKQTMQILNDRLATYLKKVQTLVQANIKLELQIKEFYDNKSPLVKKDMSSYFETIAGLRTQIQNRYVENATLRLQLDNVRLTAEDLQIKHDTEMNFRLSVESDMTRLRGVFGTMKLSIGELENHLAGLKEDLLVLKNNHEEDMRLLREQQSGSVNVEIDCTTRTDLDKELQEMRTQYETLIEKNRKEVELWFQSKVEVLQTQVTTSCSEIKTSEVQLTTVKKTFQTLETEFQGVLAMKQQVEQTVSDAGMRYTAQLSELQLNIDRLQEDLQRLNVSIQEQATEYKLLLDIKMRLEMEIAEYRRLLEGEGQTSIISTASASSTTETETVTETVTTATTATTATTETTEIVEEVHNPHLQRRVKIIVEEIVDGEVVATNVDEKIQDLN